MQPNSPPRRHAPPGLGTVRCEHGPHYRLHGQTCKNRRCPSYTRLWTKDTFFVVMSALTAYADSFGDAPGLVQLGMLTAPGADLLPFDPRHCSHPPDRRCSGDLGCRVDDATATAWNLSAPKRWAQLHQAVQLRVQRQTGVRARLLVRAWQFQKRNVLHVHPVLAYSTAVEMGAAHAYWHHLADLAPVYGFGRLSGTGNRGPSTMPARDAAAYVSAYLTHRVEPSISSAGRYRDRRSSSMVLSHRTDMPARLVYVATRLTQASGCTMRRLRLRRWYFILERENGMKRSGNRFLFDSGAEAPIAWSDLHPELKPYAAP